jgi:hypothetical protein
MRNGAALATSFSSSLKCPHWARAGLSRKLNPAVLALVLTVGERAAESILEAANHFDIPVVHGGKTGFGIRGVGLLPFCGFKVGAQ